jgi:hypothetical protein
LLLLLGSLCFGEGQDYFAHDFAFVGGQFQESIDDFAFGVADRNLNPGAGSALPPAHRDGLLWH